MSHLPIPTDIKELTRQDLARWLEERGIAPYRAAQIFRWVYQCQADSFEEMSDLNKPLRHQLAEQFVIGRLRKSRVEFSRDGSIKYLLRLTDGRFVESVLIPEKEHYTLCISSQVGCAQGCRFCLTAREGLIRSLTMGEIVAQVRDAVREIPAADPRRFTNIVFMGMGEPLANLTHVINALGVILDAESGLKFSSRRVTVSTAGIAPKLGRLGLETDVNLAVSLNAADNKTRDFLMPINRKYPIEVLMAACREYPLKPRRRITFEYILIGGVNDGDEDARGLARLLAPIRAKINLIPFNAYGESPFRRPDEARVLSFQKILTDRNYTAVIRYSKGQDISAACGQLNARQIDRCPEPADPPAT
ncbi:23S rRNA (adenine(2503)-C(2))-methyltransferase RlmN [Desulfococcus sp.]|uniref:23S rRNA (adenine(2503)-C(2))-methyltransferase RlmN n=1 Tax=Desulfococcus sp. TaxID=2025834 RepID=UPI0035945AB8